MMATGVYAIPKVESQAQRSVVTNTTPIGAYRGAGRPEATAAIERAVDLFAAEIGMDPAEVRRRNLLAPVRRSRTRTPTGATYDCGDYPRRARPGPRRPPATTTCAPSRPRRRAAGDRVALGIGAVDLRRDHRRAHRRRRSTAGSRCARRRRRRVVVYTGTLAARPGPRHRLRHDGAATRSASRSTASRSCTATPTWCRAAAGTMGSRSLQLGGAAVHEAAPSRWSTRPAAAAAELLEAAAADVVLDADRGASTSPGTPAVRRSWAEVAPARRRRRPARRARLHRRPARRSRSAPTSPSSRSTPRPARCGCVRLVAVDDAGRILNPLLVEGQIHGGIAQGVAQALFEEVALRRRRQPAHRQPSPTTPSSSAAELPSLRARRHGDARRRSTRSAPRASASPARSARRRRCRTRSSTRSPTSASATSTCRARPSGCGGPSPPPAENVLRQAQQRPCRRGQ